MFEAISDRLEYAKDYLSWRFYEISHRSELRECEDECMRVQEIWELEDAIAERVDEEDAAEGRFLLQFSDKLDKLFEEYPSVIRWQGAAINDICLTIKGKKGAFVSEGRIILDDDQNISRWESNSKLITFERINPTLSEEHMSAQITGLLKDSPDVSKYCEQVASTLLEKSSCIFNVPFGLKLKDDEYTARYGSKEWESAWVLALKKEFQAIKVITTDKTGCFQMEAI